MSTPIARGICDPANAYLIALCEATLRQIDAIADLVVPSPVSSVLGSIRHACIEYLRETEAP